MFNSKHSFPEIETERLNLGPHKAVDVPGILKLYQCQDNLRYFGMEPFSTLQEAEDQLSWYQSNQAENTGMHFALRHSDSADIIGFVHLYDYDSTHQRCEIGYMITREFSGRGLMTEGIRVVLNWIFDNTDVNRIEAYCDPRNPGSEKILEKLGFQKEGVFREYEKEGTDFVPIHFWALIRRDWPGKE